MMTIRKCTHIIIRRVVLQPLQSVGSNSIVTSSLTIGVHAQEGYGYLSCVCVCVSIRTLASTAFVSAFQVRYVRLLFRL